MNIPPPEEIRKLTGRDVLALGADWFESEGRRVVGSIDAVTQEWGAAAVGHEMRVHAGMCFAFSALLTALRAKAVSGDARKSDSELASVLADAVRTGMIPQKPKVSKNAT